ncbi:MAG: 6,7-dimethyl-8-ribityllumazine synthase [Bacteroidales bacterium]|mgnify:CR=1 FL=1|jgi:6,7-dimethyl-8-ribityllumazine synthase|nr:6,7-dimethyl-8-ribityllumazine synthase [Bacteroidales bacterium]MDD4702718.1 6,7-dimethyl-8-ribityllumazine synthase [Bacteroidales bacterium]
MSTALKNLSSSKDDFVPSGKDGIYGIVVSEWNREITEALLEGAVSTLIENNVDEKDIYVQYVPGSFELPLGASKLVEKKRFDAVICLGCVIQGETRHFDFICDAVANGIMDVSLRKDIPVVFGLLTTNTLEQAKARSGGEHGNKGVEAAITALKMADL